MSSEVSCMYGNILCYFLYIDLRVLVLHFAPQRKKQWHHHCTIVQVAKSCQQISTENVDYLLEQHIRDEKKNH